jgi:hypothetical protein
MTPKWIDGKPETAGTPGFFWVVNEEGDKAVVEIDLDGDYRKPKTLGKIVAYSGPIEEPDDDTLP